MNTYQDWNPVIFRKGDKKDRHPSSSSSFKNSNNENHIDSVLSGVKSGSILKTIDREKSKRLIQYRITLKLTREQLAQKINVTPKTITNAENGTLLKNDPHYNKIISFLK